MGTIKGGKVIEPSTNNPGIKPRVYYVDAVPTDASIGATAVNGMIACDMTTGNFYERQTGAWVRIDTL